MKKTLSLSIILSIVGGSCVVAAYFSSYYYNLYRTTVSDYESRVVGRVVAMEEDVRSLKQHG